MIDTVVDGVTGVHVPPRDPAALAGALRRACWPTRRRRAALGPAGVRAGARPLRAGTASPPRPEASTEDAARPRRGRAARDRRCPPMSRRSTATGARPLGALLDGRSRALDATSTRLDAWGAQLAAVLVGGGRLLAAGNGGSAAQAQHLTAELVGRYRDERPPLSRDRAARRDLRA